MPFYDNGDQQVRLRFSRYTKEVLQHDMFLFGESRENTLINTIIRNFYETADASIHMRLEKYRNTLEENMPRGITKASANAILNTLTEIEEKRLVDLASSYEAPDKTCKSKPYRLQNDIYEELTDQGSSFQENLYYKDSRSAYLRTLIEEYAHLPYIKRERIYFKEFFDIIENAIAQNKQLLITVSSGKSYHTLPYKILCDPLSTTNYLAGYSYPVTEEKENKYTVSYKISAIRKIRLEKSKSGYLHPDDIAALITAISEKGVQFLVSEDVEIRVRFTEDGMHSFQHWIHLRPEPLSIEKQKDSYIAVFHCSLVQASAYFFKFGTNAEILSPASLRDQFRDQYQDALSRYLGT